MTTAATATAAQAGVPVPRSGRAEAPSELRASRRYVKGEKQGLGPTVRKAPFASSGQTRVHPQNQPNCRSLAGLGITATTNGAHRQECLCHGCRLEGGATKAPGSRVLFMMALSRRAAGHPGLQGQRPTLRDFFFLAQAPLALKGAKDGAPPSMKEEPHP